MVMLTRRTVAEDLACLGEDKLCGRIYLALRRVNEGSDLRIHYVLRVIY